MPIIIFTALFLLVLVSFLANPAPVSIEFLDLVLIALPCFIALLCISISKTYKLFQSQANLVVAIILYLSYLLLSALIGLLHGIPLLNVLRSIGPYLNFFPLLLLGFLPPQVLRPKTLSFILIAVALVQTAYLSYLYFGQATSIQNTASVLIKRITTLDQRATVPLLLALPILPLIFLLKPKNSKKERFLLAPLAGGLMIVGLFAGIITLTRAIFLSIIFGWLVFTTFYLYGQIRLKTFSARALFKKIGIYLPIFLIIMALLSTIPQIYLMESGLVSRFIFYSGSKDYSDGRLYDEWLPALTTWANSDLFNIFFGIGAGNTFTVLSGEERTYIHNLSIYSLVYGGFFGFFACLWLYFTIFKTLIQRAYQTANSTYLGFAALLASLFFYAQLFAVHKGLAFNLMLFLIIGLALRQPLTEVKSHPE